MAKQRTVFELMKRAAGPALALTVIGFFGGLRALTPPAIVEFDFDPSSINTYGNSRSVTATVRAIDMKAGVRSITVIFHRPGDDFLYGISMDASNRVSGDDKDGVYTQTRIFPQNTPPGIYEAFVSVTDTLGNSYFINAGELARRRFPHELKINFAAPGELVRRVKATMAAVRAVDDHEQAVDVEL